MDERAGAWQKLQSAQGHIEAFEERLKTWLRDKSYHLVRDPNTPALQKAMLLRSEPIEPSMLCIVGDAVHNLRSALDHLAYSVAIANGAASGQLKKVSFTARRDEGCFRKDIRKEIAALGDDWVAFVEDLQPYLNGRGSDLYAICQLDNIDKHRNLLLLVTVADKYRLDSTSTTMSMTVLERSLPVEDGVRLVADADSRTFTQVRVSFGESDCGLDADAWVQDSLRALAFSVKKTLLLAELRADTLFKAH